MSRLFSAVRLCWALDVKVVFCCQVVLGSSQTYELMHCLEELTQELSRHNPASARTPISATPQASGRGASAAASAQVRDRVWVGQGVDMVHVKGMSC